MNRLMTCFALVVFLAGCSESAYEPQPEIVVEYYTPSFRQLPPEATYSRMTWSHLPGPRPDESSAKTPFLAPIVQVDLPNSTVEEALEAVAQTMGYELHFPAKAAKRPVSLKMEATIPDVLEEINRQGKIRATLDHKNRLIEVVDSGELQPRLPGGIQ